MKLYSRVPVFNNFALVTPVFIMQLNKVLLMAQIGLCENLKEK
jgi:hypothetical protein